MTEAVTGVVKGDEEEMEEDVGGVDDEKRGVHATGKSAEVVSESEET